MYTDWGWDPNLQSRGGVPTGPTRRPRANGEWPWREPGVHEGEALCRGVGCPHTTELGEWVGSTETPLTN